MSMLEYKDYLGTVEYSPADHCLFGRLAGIRDLVNYEATSVRLLEKAFKEAVDDYLADCKKRGREPQKPFKGSFNIRIGAELHRQAMIAAGEQSLNAFVCDAIQEKVAKAHVRATR